MTSRPYTDEDLRTAVELFDLAAALRVPTAGARWITSPATGRPGLIAPVTGQLVWLHPVTSRAITAAETAGLITLGPIQPMPEYRGGGRYRWHAGMHGRVIALA